MLIGKALNHRLFRQQCDDEADLCICHVDCDRERGGAESVKRVQCQAEPGKAGCGDEARQMHRISARK